MFDFEAEYPEEPDISQAYYRRRLLPRHEHGRHVRRRRHLRLGFSISAAPQALSFSYDGKAGLYRISQRKAAHPCRVKGRARSESRRPRPALVGRDQGRSSLIAEKFHLGLG